MPLSALASDSEDLYNLDGTTIENDLSTLYPNLSESFPVDEEDDGVYLIYFTEYGYSEEGKEHSSNYNLYLYIYNPSRKSLSSDLSKVQFATQWSRSTNGEIAASEYEKFSLKFLKQSSFGNGTVFKYKVTFKSPDFVYHGNNGSRRYDISGIELGESDFDISDYSVGITYTFSGYGKGLSYESRDKSTLSFIIDKLTTISVDVHQVSYLTGNSSLGIHDLDVPYSNQVNSVYFSLPQNIENKYGNLYSIKYEYNHFYTAPIIVTDNTDSYNILLSDVGKKVDHDKWDYDIHNGWFREGGIGGKMDYYWYYGRKRGDELALDRNYNYAETISYLSSVFLNQDYENGWEYGDVLVEASELERYFKHYNSSYHTGEVLGYSADLFDLEKSDGYVCKTSNIDDAFTLEGFSSTHNDFLRILWFGFGNAEDYEDMKGVKYIEKITSEDVILAEDFERNFLIDDIYKDEFYDFYVNSILNQKNVYILRYACAPDYYSFKCQSEGIGGHFIVSQGNTYLNFDIIQFTFKDKLGKQTTIPVVSDPSNGFFNVTNTVPDHDLGDLVEDILSGKANQDSAWRRFVAVVVLLIIFILIVAAFVLACIYIPGFGASVLALLTQLMQLVVTQLKAWGIALGNLVKTGIDNLSAKAKQGAENIKKRKSEKKHKKSSSESPSGSAKKKQYRRNNGYRRSKNYKKQYRSKSNKYKKRYSK